MAGKMKLVNSLYEWNVIMIVWIKLYCDWTNWITFQRSSCPEVFCKKGVLRNVIKFTRKHLCQSLFFDKVAGLRHATLIIKETLAQVLSSEFYEISKNTFFYRTLLVAAFAFWNILTLFSHENFHVSEEKFCQISPS